MSWLEFSRKGGLARAKNRTAAELSAIGKLGATIKAAKRKARGEKKGENVKGENTAAATVDP